MKNLAAIFILITSFSGCALLRFDPLSPYIRSELVTSPEIEKQILSKAHLERTTDGRIPVLFLSGTPYEIGYQHGALLREEIQDNWEYLYKSAISKFGSAELFEEVYERMRPHIPKAYLEEMHGLAHGSKTPLSLIHAIHILPEIGEWGGKKKLKEIIKKMLAGDLGTSCSNLAARGSATADGGMYVVRILDWGLHRISKLHKYPLITVVRPTQGIPYVNIGWVGFLGAISGMNAEGITLGEMGYGDPANETLHGKPMPFLLRDVLSQAKNLNDVRKIIKSSTPTNSFVFLMSDGKARDAEIYIRDPDRFLIFRPNQRLKDRNDDYPPLKDIVYGGHYEDRMISELAENQGKITPELLANKIIPALAMPSNFQNVIYDPVNLKFWVNNAKSKSERAAEQPMTEYDFKSALIKLGLQ